MEWEGEIWWWISTQPDAGRSIRERLALFLHCLGAIADGLCLWLEDEDRVAALHAAFRKPGACLAAGVLLLALIGGLSGGFESTRRALQSAFSPRDPDLAILSQAGPFMGQRLGVPAIKVAYWDRHAEILQGAAVYAWYRSVIGADSTHATDRPAAKVGVRFFSLLKARPLIGRVFAAGDDQSCADCVVLGYGFWKRHFGSDPRIIGRTMTVDRRTFRVIGVLRKEIWFLDEVPAAWTLFDGGTWSAFPAVMTGAICRLRPGITPAVAERELRALPGDTWITVTPLDAIVRRPINSLAPLFGSLVGAAIFGALFVRGGVIPAAFFLAKAVVLLAIAFVAGIEFGGAASMTRIGGTTVASATAVFWMLAAGCISLRWVWIDQRKRCPRCLRRLALPVRIGEGSRRLLELSGTEMACPRGHGTLFSGDGASTAPDDRWSQMDATWSGLFEPLAKTSR